MGGVELDPIITRFLEIFGGVCKTLDDAVDFFLRGLVGVGEFHTHHLACELLAGEHQDRAQGN